MELLLQQSLKWYLEQVDRMKWRINLENSCWLDVSWETGMMETHLLVPSADLGVYVTLASGKPIVTKVLLSLLSFIKKVEARNLFYLCDTAQPLVENLVT